MNAVCRWNFQSGLVLAVTLFASIIARPAFAYTSEQEQACTGDAMRLCSAFIPDVDRITACMVRSKSQLSPGCRAHFRAGPEPREAAGPPTDIKPVVRKPVKPVSAKARKPKKPARPAAT